MNDQLQRAFGEMAEQAHTSPDMLEAVRQRVNVRRVRRRRIAVGGTVAAVACVATAAVLASNAIRQANAASATPTVSSASSAVAVATEDGSCLSSSFAPAFAPLVAAPVPTAQNLGLGVVPRGWVLRASRDSDAVYSDPADHSSSDSFIGKIATSISEAPHLDFHPTTTIAGHPATMVKPAPCPSGYPGTWGVNLQFNDHVLVQVQGPMSMGLSDAQIMDIAASVVVRKLIPGLG